MPIDPAAILPPDVIVDIFKALAASGTAVREFPGIAGLSKAYRDAIAEITNDSATNIGISIVRDEAAGEYVINGSKWWCTGAGSLHCKIMILMGKTDPTAKLHRQQSQILVPMDT